MAALVHLDPFLVWVVTVTHLTQVGIFFLDFFTLFRKVETERVLDVLWVTCESLDGLGD